MQTLPFYLEQYSESHRNVKNVRIHSICVPAIMWSVLGFAGSFNVAGPVHAGHLIVWASLTYYGFFRNPRVVMAMAVVAAVMLFSFLFVPELRWVSLGVFTIAWIGQFYGHKIEGKKPSFIEDLQFLLIGPVWVLHKMFPKLLKIRFP